ncbi:MAG: DHH family phosphoesterase [Metamycoplasmataceae bacterium]
MKNKTKIILISIMALTFLLSFLMIIFFILRKSIPNFEYLLFSFFILLMIILVTYIGFTMFLYFKRGAKINYYINNFDANLIENLGFGIMIISINEEIIWCSSFVIDRFGSKIINKKITSIIPSIKISDLNNDYETVVFKNNLYYQVNYFAKKMILTIKDITTEQLILNKYNKEKLVIGELDIDNFQKYQSSLSEEEIFSISSLINSVLEKMSQKYNWFFKQYSNGRYIIVTNEKDLENLEKSGFSDFDEINSFNKIKNIKVSASIGFGRGSNDFLKLTELSKNALQQAQSRGGNQVAILSFKGVGKFYGSKSEISVEKNRASIKMVAENFDKRIRSKDIQKVVIYGHINADLDAIGSAYAFYCVAKNLKKEVYIQNQIFDETAQKALNNYFSFSEQKQIFITKTKANAITDRDTLVVVVDCSEKQRVENDKIFEKTLKENIFIFDHHRVSKIDDNINHFNVYIETTASSASEITTEIISFNNYQKYLEKRSIQLLLDGIYLDTNRFQKSVSSRTFVAASILEDLGANPANSIDMLKISNDASKIIANILETIIEVKPGFWLAAYDGEVPIDIISIASDEILRISGRRAAFVIAKLPKSLKNNKDIYKLSARGIDTNVQIIAEAVGGGGHFSAAAANSDFNVEEKFVDFKNNVIQAIISLGK